jgi:hypothetical protein
MAFKVKFNGQGDVETYNARLVTRGFIQVVNIDYTYFLTCCENRFHLNYISTCNPI